MVYWVLNRLHLERSLSIPLTAGYRPSRATQLCCQKDFRSSLGKYIISCQVMVYRVYNRLHLERSLGIAHAAGCPAGS